MLTNDRQADPGRSCKGGSLLLCTTLELSQSSCCLELSWLVPACANGCGNRLLYIQCIHNLSTTNSNCTSALESSAFFLENRRSETIRRNSPHQRAPASDPASLKYASAHTGMYMRLTSWQAGFHTNRAADILASRLSHQPRPQLTARLSGLSHQPQVSHCSNWPYSRSQTHCSPKILLPACIRNTSSKFCT
jgi:hypothetical protein